MNDLLKLTSEMVNNINNTSNFTNLQNSTWKNPIQNQEDKINEIHQQFLKAEKFTNTTQFRINYIINYICDTNYINVTLNSLISI